MRSTRAAYHRAVRHIKKNQEDKINEKFAHALMDNNNRDFWKEVKHIRSNHSTSVKFVDGMCDSCDIAGIFATKYQDLYSCVSYRSSDMSHKPVSWPYLWGGGFTGSNPPEIITRKFFHCIKITCSIIYGLWCFARSL